MENSFWKDNRRSRLGILLTPFCVLLLFGLACQVSAAGGISPVLPNDLRISPFSGLVGDPAIAFDGTNYLVVWVTTDQAALKGQFVSKSGALVGPVFDLITPGTQCGVPDVVFNGQYYCIVYSGMKPGGGSNSKIGGVLISPTGDQISSFDIPIQNEDPAIAWDGTNFLVVWTDQRNHLTNGYDIYGQFISSTGSLVGANFPISTSPLQVMHPDIVFGGDNYLVVWQEDAFSSNGQIFGTRVSQTGSVLDPNGIAISTAPSSQGDWRTPTASFGDNTYFVVWDDYRFYPHLDIYGARVSLDGVLLDGPPESGGIAIVSNDGWATSPRGAEAVFDGSQWFIVYGTQTKGARVSSSGVLLDTQGVKLSKDYWNEFGGQKVSFDGSKFLVIWNNRETTGYYTCYGQMVSLNAPIVTSITPSTGANSGTISITDLTGSAFVDGATVKLTKIGQTDIIATDIVWISPTKLTCNFSLSGAITGTWNVVVTNPDGATGTLTNRFTVTVAAPNVTGITPSEGINTGTVAITDLAGSGFVIGASVKLTKDGQADITATDVSWKSSSKLTCNLPIRGAAAGPWNVVVTNPDGQTGMLTNGFTVNYPDQAPILDTIGTRIVRKDAVLTFMISATDPDAGDTLTFSASNLPMGAIFDPSSRTFTWTPTSTQIGTYPGVTFEVTDGRGLSDSEVISITVESQDPVGEWTPVGPRGRWVLFFIVSPDYQSDQTIIANNNMHQPTLTDVTKDFGATWTERNCTFSNYGALASIVYDGTTHRFFTVGGNGGHTIASNDAGLTWYSILDSGAYSIDARSNDVFVGALNKIGISSNGGSSFEWITPTVENGLASAYASGPGPFGAIQASPNFDVDRTIFAAAGWTGMWKTTDAGAHWSTINTGLPPFNGSLTVQIQDLVVSPNFKDDRTLFIINYNDGIYRSTNGGNSWERAMPNKITGVPSIDISPNYAQDGVVIFSGFDYSHNRDTVWISQDRGLTWAEIDTSGLTVNMGVSVEISPNFDSDKTLFLGTYDGIWEKQLTLTEPNHPPILASIGAQTAAEGTELIIDVNAEDADQDVLAYSLENGPEGSSINPDTGLFRWTPSYTQASQYTVTFKVSDGQATDSEDVTIAVNNVNRAPVLAPVGDKDVNEGATLSFTITASDDEPVTFSMSGLPEGSGATLDPTSGEFTWTPGYDKAGLYDVTFNATDGALEDSETVKITVNNVNRAPVMDPVVVPPVDEGSMLSFAISASDPDNDEISYSASDLPDGAIFNPSSGTFTWTPGYDKAGSYDVTFNATDGELQDSETVKITVNDINQAPILAPVGDKDVNEGATLSFTITASDDEPVTFSMSGLPEGSGATLDPTSGEFTWTPGYDKAGSYDVTFNATDGALEDSETVKITVNDINQAPILAPVGDKDVNEGATLSFTITASDDEPVTFSMSGLPEGSDATLDPASGTFTWTPGYDKEGSYDVTFTATDGELQDSERVKITVNNINRPPVADAGSDQVLEVVGEFVTLDGSRSYDDDGDTLTYQWIFIKKPSGSTASITGGATATPSFTADKVGDYVVQLVVKDNALSSTPDTVTLSFANLKPIADAGISQSVIIGETVSLDGTQSYDLNEGTTLTYRWSIATAPVGSVAMINNPTAASTSFKPDKVGTYNIQLVVNDGLLNSDSSYCQVEVVAREMKVVADIQNVQTIIGTIDPGKMKNTNMQNALINKLNAVIADIGNMDYQDAINKLQNDVLAKTDGCALSGAPDKNDWINDCEPQTLLYGQIQSIIDELKGF
jgi:hypothetical protein